VSPPLTAYSLHRIRGQIGAARLSALPGAGDDGVDRLLTLLWEAEQLAGELCGRAAPTGHLHARVRTA
jgi:hypothetical protein